MAEERRGKERREDEVYERKRGGEMGRLRGQEEER